MQQEEYNSGLLDFIIDYIHVAKSKGGLFTGNMDTTSEGILV